MHAWAKEVAPSAELRQWFGHKPERWPEFRRRYEKELSENAAAWSPILDAARQGTVTLLFSAHDLERNSAVVLRDFLEKRSARAQKAVTKKPVTKTRRRSASSAAHA